MTGNMLQPYPVWTAQKSTMSGLAQAMEEKWLLADLRDVYLEEGYKWNK